MVAAEVQDLAPYPRQFTEIEFACRVIVREHRHVHDECFDESVARVEACANLRRRILHPGLHDPRHAWERALLRGLHGADRGRHVDPFGLPAFMEEVAREILRLDSVDGFDAAVPRGGAAREVRRSRVENRRPVVAAAPFALLQERPCGESGGNHSVKALKDRLDTLLTHARGYETSASAVGVDRRLVERAALACEIPHQPPGAGAFVGDEGEYVLFGHAEFAQCKLPDFECAVRDERGVVSGRGETVDLQRPLVLAEVGEGV